MSMEHYLNANKTFPMVGHHWGHTHCHVYIINGLKITVNLNVLEVFVNFQNAG